MRTAKRSERISRPSTNTRTYRLLLARNAAGVTMPSDGPERLPRGREGRQGCRIRGNACAAGRRADRGALASTGADARSARSCTRCCVRTSRLGSLGRRNGANETTNAPQGGAATVRAGQPLWLVYLFRTVALGRCLNMAKWSVDDCFSVRSGRSTPIR